MDFKKMNFITTVVGSYPTNDFKPISINEKINNHLGLYDPYKQAIVETVKCLIKADIDIICDGQVRGDMIKIFAQKINGMKIIDNSVYINGKITPSAHPISIKDFKLTYKLAKSIDAKFKLHASLDEIFNHEARGVKGIITGPTTLVHSSIIDSFYTSKANAIYDTAKALQREAQELEKIGACLIQIDEPFISTGAEDISVSKKAIEMISDSVDIPIMLHVCGDLTNVLKDLLKFNVDILDFEFAGMSNNINILKEVWNPTCNKLVGIGCVDTKKDFIDEKNKVKKTIKEVIEITQSKNIIIDPDCGMRMLPEKIASGKLEILKDIRSKGV